MEIKTSTEGSKATIELIGKLTVQSSPELSAVVEGLPNGICDIDMDIANMSYVASSGLRVLVASDKLVIKRGGCMRLLHPTAEVMEILEMTGLSEVFKIER